MVKEKVVEFVRSYDILGLLADVPVFIRRQKFGADRCIHYVVQDIACAFPASFVEMVVGTPFYEVSYQSLRNVCDYQ